MCARARRERDTYSVLVTTPAPMAALITHKNSSSRPHPSWPWQFPCSADAGTPYLHYYWRRVLALLPLLPEDAACRQ